MSHWYYQVSSGREGPVSLEQIRATVRAGRVTADTMVWCQGWPSWKKARDAAELWTNAPVAAPAAAGAPGRPPVASRPGDDAGVPFRIAAILGALVGTDRVRREDWARLLGGIFRLHDSREAETLLAAGTARTTPSLNEVSTAMPQPWLFSRLLGWAAVAMSVAWLVWSQRADPGLLPGMLIIASLSVPLATLIFFLECNVARSVSLLVSVRLFAAGGFLAMAISPIWLSLDTQAFWNALGRPVQGLFIEAAKLVLVLVMVTPSRFRWTLEGACLGAAVGCGFAAFEFARWPPAADAAATLGGMSAPFWAEVWTAALSHGVWTAITIAALWRAKGAGPLRPKCWIDRRFLAPFIFVLILQAFWRAKWVGDLPFHLGWIVLGLAAWVVAIGLVLGGVREIRNSQFSRGVN